MTSPISACVICRNEADKIQTCLDSLAWCSDIVVVDSGSTDDTAKRAAAHQAQPRVLRQNWRGYCRQREFAVRQCRHAWVLALDADEECSPELAREIQSLPESVLSANAMFRIPRKNFLAGRWVRCWSPDYQTRLLHGERIEWDSRSIPETRRPKPGFRIGTLRGSLLHNRTTPYHPGNFNDGPVMAERAELLARHMLARGQKATFGNLLLRPASTFLKYYLLRGGFLQGRFGLVVCYKTTIGVMLKYSVLYGEQELGAARGNDKILNPAAPEHRTGPER